LQHAVLFDLDDTIFDHKHSRRCGLKAIQADYPELSTVPIEILEGEHEVLLQADYGKVLDGTLSLIDARARRAGGLFLSRGIDVDQETIYEASTIYNKAYEIAMRPVPGVAGVLLALSQKTDLAVVTNGLNDLQRRKLRICQVEHLFREIVISENIGSRKPDHAIFKAALDALDIPCCQAVMVGDSWSNDILPARALGMKPIWLNRYGRSCPDPAVAAEIHDFVDVDLEIFLKED
jgi:putative hydrolase of the HAD superfamily